MTDEPPAREAELSAIDMEANILTHLLCFRCERHFEQHSESTIADVDLWSHDVAARAVRAGWRFADRQILCPECFSRSSA